MKRPPIESAGAFRARYLARGAVPGLLGSLMIVGYFAGTLDLGPEGWRAFGYSMLGLIAITTPYGQWLQRRIDRPITHALERIAAGKQTHEDMRNAYVAARELPRRAMLVQISNYVFATFLVPLWMAISVPDTGAFALIVLAMASISGGAATIPFSLFAMQRFVDSTRDYFAAQLSPEERQALAPPRSLTAKLALPVLASSLAAITFLVLLGYSVAIRLLEQQDVRVKAAFLESATEWLDSGRATPEKVVEVARKRGVATDVEIVAVAGGDASALGLSAREIDWIRGAVRGRTSSLGLDSAASFAWRPLAGEPRRVLVAASPVHDLAGDMTDTLLVVIAVLLGISGVSLGVALLAGADVRRTAERLRAEAARVGAGDLTGGAVIESEDELGAVAHAFAAMKQKLGATLQRIAETASRVEGAAGELTEIGGAVRQVTAAQVAGIEQVSSAVSVVDRQGTEITTSAQTLIGSVEEASSSVLELGAASEELNQTTIALGTQVEAVGSSIEEMVRSLAQTSEATEALGSSVVDTSSSVAEMARSMQSVDAHAWETARLSTRVIELAEGGRDRVKETIAGMEAIRDATDSANRVIGGLSSRMHEIGAIVDVIDEVADETNLLALNAAIIAAQAGDQGRAFSVVADEIKDLADRVLANTKEIGGLIRSVQGEAAAAADAIRAGAESVQGGVDLSAQAGVALEEITSAARHAGERIQEIVHAMREQTRAASHVEQLIEGVGTRVEQIKNAGREQGRGNEVVMRGSLVMRDVAAQTQRTTEEQSRGALRIRDSIEGVRDAVDRIHVSLQHQSTSCRSASEALGAVIERTRSNDDATDRLSRAGATLQELAEKLREDMRKFRIA